MSKQSYIDWAAQHSDSVPLFMQPWWLDAVCRDMSWDAITSVDEEGGIIGAWAFARTKMKGLEAVVLPPLTPFTGIWLDIDSNLPHHKQETLRQDILSDLEKQLPRAPILELKLQWTLQDWIPFYWQGYRQETRYTFRFPEPDPEAILAAVSKSFRRNYRAAQRKFDIRISTDADELADLVEHVFEIREDEMPFDKSIINLAIQALSARNQCAIYSADQADGNARAAILCAWDNSTTYYLLGGRTGSNTQNATNLLIMRAIGDAAERGQAFDFEGSMIKGVHKFFQSFGAHMQPYMFLYRYRGPAKLKSLL